MNLSMTDFDTALSIVTRLTEQGHRALFCGGSVRDSLLGLRPKDYDIVTSARSEQVMDLFPRTYPVGRRFGIIVVVENGTPYEVATFRCDGDYQDGRHPRRVSYGSEEEDARRRDFTINGLFLDPLTNELIDHVGGRSDLESGIVRTIGDSDRRFEEDHLRLLRAARLAAQLGFDIDPDTRAAMGRHASALSRISRERIGDEIEKVLTGPRAGYGIRILAETGLMQAAIPGFDRLDVVTMERTIGRLDRIGAGAEQSLALSALLLDLSRDGIDAKKVVGELRRTRRVACRIGRLLAEEKIFCRYEELSIADQRRFLRSDLIEDLLLLMELDLEGRDDAGPVERMRVERCRNDRTRYEADGIGLRPALPIGGKDLLEIGIASGPRIGAILRAVEEQVLMGSVRTREEALDWVRSPEQEVGEA